MGVKKEGSAGFEVYYRELCEAASKLGFEIREDNLLKLGVKTEGGFCWYRGQDLVLIERALPVKKRFELLRDVLKSAECDLGRVYLSPAVRRVLGQNMDGG